jgi:hypothetical protein
MKSEEFKCKFVWIKPGEDCSIVQKIQYIVFQVEQNLKECYE